MKALKTRLLDDEDDDKEQNAPHKESKTHNNKEKHSEEVFKPREFEEDSLSKRLRSGDTEPSDESN